MDFFWAGVLGRGALVSSIGACCWSSWLKIWGWREGIAIRLKEAIRQETSASPRCDEAVGLLAGQANG